MFDSICVHNPQTEGSVFDLGTLAEAMIFYRRTRVLVNPAELVSLLRICGPESLCAALGSGFIELAYLENHLGVATVNAGRPNERLGLVMVETQAQKLPEYIYDTLHRWTNNRRKSRALTDQVLRYATPIKWPMSEAEAAKNDLLASDFVGACAKAVIRDLSRGYAPPDDAYYRVRLAAETAIEQRGFRMGLFVETNFDFNQAAAVFRQSGSEGKFEAAGVLSQVFGGLTDLKVAASFSDEMAVSPIVATIAELKLSQLLTKRAQSAEKIEVFQEWTCEEGRAIREALRQGKRNFDDILHLAEQAARFKEWLAEQPESADLNREYLKAVCSVGWADKLPSKAIRLLIFQALGGALSLVTTPVGGLAVGTALSVLDSFLVDRLVKGWKPSQFVEGALKDFVQ